MFNVQAYGLDGLTFGILDFTANELPEVFELYMTNAEAAGRLRRHMPFLFQPGANGT